MIIAYLLTSFVFYFGLMALFAAHNPIFSMICCLVFILCHKHFRLVQNIKISAIRSFFLFSARSVGMLCSLVSVWICSSVSSYLHSVI